MNKVWYVYILECADQTLYCGITTNLTRRLSEHNQTSRGSKYVRPRRPARLVYFETVESRSEAQSREFQIKRLKRNQKLELIRKAELE